MILEFVLVEPALPENVGAAARALKTMGFTSLSIVGSKCYLEKKARILAHGSNDILANINYYESLQAAIQDCDLVVATTAKFRHQIRYIYHPEALAGHLKSKGAAVRRVSIVFGREESGLSNEELHLCDIISSIPMAVEYPSLNLAQAVMLYAYQLSSLHLPEVNQETVVKQSQKIDGQWQALKKKVHSLLEQQDFDSASPLHRWAIQRLAVLTEKDIHFLHSLSDRLMESTQCAKESGAGEGSSTPVIDPQVG